MEPTQNGPTEDIKALWRMVNGGIPDAILLPKLTEVWQRIEREFSAASFSGDRLEEIMEENWDFDRITIELDRRGRRHLLEALSQIRSTVEAKAPVDPKLRWPGVNSDEQPPCDFNHPCACGSDHR